jgi:hypothetical protein
MTNPKAHVTSAPRVRLKYLGKSAEESMPFDIALAGIHTPNWATIKAKLAKATAAREREESFAWDCKVCRRS